MKSEKEIITDEDRLEILFPRMMIFKTKKNKSWLYRQIGVENEFIRVCGIYGLNKSRSGLWIWVKKSESEAGNELDEYIYWIYPKQ